MIPNVTRGGGFAGCVNYIFQEEKKAKIIATNMVGRSSAELIAEFEITCERYPRSSIPVWHVSLSARPDEVISNPQWREISERLIDKVGTQASPDEIGISTEWNQYFAASHYDKLHPHVHIVLNRISVTGELSYCKWDHNRVQKACREIEQEFGLVIVLGKQPGVEPSPSLTCQAIACLKRQEDRTRVIAPALQNYYDYRQKRLKEILNERRISESDAPDRVGTPAADCSETKCSDLAETTGRTHGAVANLVESFAASNATASNFEYDRGTVDDDRISTPISQLDFSSPAPTGATEWNGESGQRVESASHCPRAENPNLQRGFAEFTQRLGSSVANLSQAIADFVDRQILGQCSRLFEKAVEQLDRYLDYFQLPTDCTNRPEKRSSRSNATTGSQNRGGEPRQPSLTQVAVESSNVELPRPLEQPRLDGTSIGERVARRLESDRGAARRTQSEDQRSSEREFSPQAPVGGEPELTLEPRGIASQSDQSASDTTGRPTEQPPDGNAAIANQLAQFADDLQRAHEQRRIQRQRDRKGLKQPGESDQSDSDHSTADRAQTADAPERSVPSFPRGGNLDPPQTGRAAFDHDQPLRDSRVESPANPPRHSAANISAPEQPGNSDEKNREAAEIKNTPSEKSIEQWQEYYGQLWQQANIGLRSDLAPFERDVQIAQKIMQSHGLRSAQGAICRSPEMQALRRIPDGDHRHTYLLRITGAAKERGLSQEQKVNGQQAAKVVKQILDGKGASEHDGKIYNARYDAAQDVLLVSAKDGRGEILRQQQGHIALSNLNQGDVELFTKTDRQLNPPPVYYSPPQKSQQLEPGD